CHTSSNLDQRRPSPTRRSSDPVVLPGAVQQRLGRNTTDVQAGTTESQLAILALVLLDTGGLESQLGCADCGNVTARPGTNNDYIDRKSTRLNSSHVKISYAVFC